jgi:hypothetical protein
MVARVSRIFQAMLLFYCMVAFTTGVVIAGAILLG